MSAFEIISADEFKSAQASPPAEGRSLAAAGGLPSQTATGGEDSFGEQTELTYCDFCKGWYIEEYHVS